MLIVTIRLAPVALLVGLLVAGASPARAVGVGARDTTQPTFGPMVQLARGVVGLHPQAAAGAADVYAPTGETIDLTVEVHGSRSK